jgi:hypothetical protein
LFCWQLRQLLAKIFILFISVFIYKKREFMPKKEISIWGGGEKEGGEGEMTNLIHQENSLGRMNG